MSRGQINLERQYDHNGTWWPPRVKAVAVRVDELVEDPQAWDCFQHMMREWKTRHDAERPGPPTDDRGRVQLSKVEFLPTRALSLAEKYARLAAIHDVVCTEAERLDPWWGNDRSLTEELSPPLTEELPPPEAMSYGVLCSHVQESAEELTDADYERIEAMFRDVEADLKGQTDQQSRVDARPAREGAAKSVKTQGSASKPSRPQPSKLAREAYQLHILLQGWKQQDIVDKMSAEHGRPMHQGTVSRWIKEVKAFLENGGILSKDVVSDLEGKKTAKLDFVDPKVLDQGTRQDGRTERQRLRHEDGHTKSN